MIFEATPEHILKLSDEDLRVLVGRLCEAEARSRGLPPVGITYGGDQNAPDGGIDVRAEVPTEVAVGFVPRRVTVFQVKAEDMPRGAIESEMCPGGILRRSIVNVAASDGAYIIVSSKGSVADAPLKERITAMRDAVAREPLAAALHLDFYDRRRLATWVNGHPSEVAWLRNRVGEPISGWHPFADWSSSPDDLATPYLLDGGIRIVAPLLDTSSEMSAEEGVAMLRSRLCKPGSVIRLVGLSGVGKTRLVQALFDARIGTGALDPTSVLYTDVGDGPTPSPLDILPRLNAAGRFHILVLDNCGSELHGAVAKRVRAGDAPISLLTVEYDLRDDQPEGTDVVRLEPASADIVEKILERKHPRLTQVERRTIASFSEGNARIALAIAATATGQGSLANLSNRALFERLFRQQNADDPQLLRAAKVFSLVYSFDGETISGPMAELPILGSLAHMNPGELHGHVAELARRQLVQSRGRWRAVLPHALAHRLAKDALQDLPPAAIQSDILDRANSRFVKSFSRRLGFLHDSREAQRIVAAWLSDGGLLGRVSDMDKDKVIILENVSPVDPGGVLRAIGQAAISILERETPEFLFRRVVGLLRSVAYDAQYFDEAAQLLAQIASGREKSNNVADPANVFASMFYIYLSGTHAPAEQRANLLRRLAASGVETLAVAGLTAMLECNHFTSSHPFEFGSRKRDYGLHPSGEGVTQWFRVALQLANDLDIRSSLRGDIRRAIAHRFRSLALQTGALDELVVLARAFAARGGWAEGWAHAKAAESAVRHSGELDDAATLAVLTAELEPTSLDDRLNAYVFDGDLHLLNDDDEEGEDDVQRAIERLHAVRADLGRDLAQDKDALDRNLPRLIAQEGGGIRTLGYGIGGTVEDPASLWAAIVGQHNRRGSSPPIGSFGLEVLRAIGERRPDLAATYLDEALANEEFHPVLVHMQVAVGLDDPGVARLMKATKRATVPTRSFHALAYGGVSVNLDDASLKDLLRAIASSEDGVAVALDVLQMRLHGRKMDGFEVTDDEREVGVYLVGQIEVDRIDQRTSRRLKDIIAACFVPGKDEAAAHAFCVSLREGVGSYRVSAWNVGGIVAVLGKLFPRIVLDVFVHRDVEEVDELNDSAQERQFSRGGFLGLVDEVVMTAWAKERPGVRFPALARIIPLWEAPSEAGRPTLLDETKSMAWTPAAKRLVREAPDPVAVLGAVERRLLPSSWTGSLADVLDERVRLLEELLSDPDERIRAWAGPARQRVADLARRQRDRELAEASERDQKFDW